FLVLFGALSNKFTNVTGCVWCDLRTGYSGKCLGRLSRYSTNSKREFFCLWLQKCFNCRFATCCKRSLNFFGRRTSSSLCSNESNLFTNELVARLHDTLLYECFNITVW